VIIQVLANLKEEGYLARGRHPTVAPFFAGGNVAFRREALQRVGGYDPKCMTGEDCDMCARTSAAGWELYMRRRAVVFHNNPSTLHRLISQWYGYGRYHPYVFAKHNDRAVEVYARLGRPVGGERYVCLLYKRWPLAAIVFLTTFLVLHLVLAGTIAAWLLGWSAVGWAGVGLSAAAAIAYAWPDVRRWGVFRGCAFTAIRYVADIALFAGALVGGFREKMLYLSATVD